jgi:hypothetical protein
MNFAFTLSITLKNEDTSSFTGSCTVSITESSNSLVAASGSLSVANSAGSASLSVYLTSTGSKTITASCPASGNFAAVSATVTVTGQALLLKINSAFTAVIFKQPANSLVSFSVIVGVYDSTGTSVESVRGPYDVTISLSPTVTVSGTWTGHTASGSITFSSLRILTWNTYTLTASSAGMTSATTSSFTTTNYVHTITMSTSNSSPSVNFQFTVTVNLFGEDGGTFIGSCLITLTESTSSLMGITSTTISTTGTYGFLVYLNSVGAKTIVATCPASGSNTVKTQSLAVTAMTLILKISPTSPTVSFT